MRGPLEGIWLKDVRGWRLTLRNPSGGVVLALNHTAPGRVLEPIRVSLDSIGTLETLSFDWKGRFDYAPSSLTCLLELLDFVHGWQEVCEGWLEQPRSRRKRSSPQFANFWKLVEGDFFSGSLPPGVAGLGIGGLNFLPGSGAPAEDAERSSQTNSSVLQKTYETLADASVGTDAQRRMILARPGVGSPVRVEAGELLDWDIGDWETPNYITAWEANPGPGWAAFSGGNPRGVLVPAKVRTAGVKFSEVTSSSGMPLLWAVSSWTTEQPLPPDPLPPDYEEPEQFVALPSGVSSGTIFEHEGKGQAVYLGYDPQRWYTGSALIPTNSSDYEPLTAYLRIGVTLLELPPEDIVLYGQPPRTWAVALDEAIWVSAKLEPDSGAVGIPGEGPGLDPSPIHPQYEVPATLPETGTVINPSFGAALRQNPRVRLYREDIGKVSYLDYPIPDALFRQDQTEEYGTSWVLHIALAYTLERTTGIPEPAKAKVRFTLERVEFGKKIAEPVDTEQGLNVPYTEGPACNGEARGALLGPAIIEGLEVRDGVFTDENVVSFSLELAGKRSTTKITTGTLPYGG